MKWNEVTWYSRLLAFIFFFGVVPALSFYMGMRYVEISQVMDMSDRMVVHVVERDVELPDELLAPTSTPSEPKDDIAEKPPVSTPQAACYRGGCSGQLCTDKPDMVSTCEWREEYACYKDAVCERQANGQCGWTESAALNACLMTAAESTLEVR